MKDVQQVEKKTLDLIREQIECLKQIFPECVTEGRVDFGLLKTTLGNAGALAGDTAYTTPTRLCAARPRMAC